MSDFEFTDNSQHFKDALESQLGAALEAIGIQAEGYAKGECPVDTGRLRNSISHDVQGDTAYIGTNVVYAPVQELNAKLHHKVGNAHFLKNSAANHGDEYKRIAEQYLKQ